MPDKRDQRTRDAYKSDDHQDLQHTIDYVDMLADKRRTEGISHPALVDILYYLRILDQIWQKGANDASDQSQEA